LYFIYSKDKATHRHDEKLLILDNKSTRDFLQYLVKVFESVMLISSAYINLRGKCVSEEIGSDVSSLSHSCLTAPVGFESQNCAY